MAKGKALGLWKGKVGSNVFYKIKNSNNSQKQGIRERIYDVANPQSAGQATQRMKLNPANRLAAALKSIIERGFEGVNYGAMSRQAFMKYALAMTSGYPAVAKDNSIIYPGSYLISRGSLPEVVCKYDGNDPTLVSTSLILASQQFATIGDLSVLLLNSNGFLQSGDQITFVYGYVEENNISSPIIWKNISFYLDENDTTEFPSETDSFLVEDGEGHLGLQTNKSGLAAAAVVISRESSVGGHLRSNATLVYNSIYAPLFTDAAYEEARQSYQKKNAALNSDWPIVDGDGDDSGGGTSAPIINNRLAGVDCAQHQNPLFFIGIHEQDSATVVISLLAAMSLVSGGPQTFNEEDVPFLNTNVRKLTAAEAAALRDAGYTIADMFVEA